MEVVKVKETTRGLGVRIVRMMRLMNDDHYNDVQDRGTYGDEIDDQPDVQLRGR